MLLRDLRIFWLNTTGRGGCGSMWIDYWQIFSVRMAWLVKVDVKACKGRCKCRPSMQPFRGRFAAGFSAASPPRPPGSARCMELSTLGREADAYNPGMAR